MLIHEKHDQQKSWDPHGKLAWYVSPAMNHYQCVSAFVPQTGKERVADTIKVFPHSIPVPEYKAEHVIETAAKNILDTLRSPPKSNLPFLNNTELQTAVHQIAESLNRCIDTQSPIQPQDKQPTADKPVSQRAPLQPSPQKVPRVQQVQSPRVQQYHIPSNNHYHNPFLYQPQALPTLYPHTNFQQQALAQLIAQQLHQPHAYMNHIYNKNTGKKETIDTLLAGENKQTWLKAVSNEFGRLTKGNKYNVKFTDTMEFISKMLFHLAKK